MSGPVALPIGRRTALVLALASIAGLMMLCWPLLLDAQPGQRVEPPFVFLALLPLVMVVVLAEMGEGGMDSRVLAVLGVLSAINAVLRGLGAGTAGIELVFFLLVLGGRVFGAGFGFALGCTSLFASALLTAGVRIWLYPGPYILHAKHLSIDDDVAVIGSSNMDIRSFALNFEVTMLVRGASFVADPGGAQTRAAQIVRQIPLSMAITTIAPLQPMRSMRTAARGGRTIIPHPDPVAAMLSARMRQRSNQPPRPANVGI